MKLPPGYGQIVKLSGKRRRPFAVRIDAGVEEKTPGHFVRKQKYLGYFEKRTDALDFLTKYNAGIDISPAPSVASLPTFSDVYEGFFQWYQKKRPDASQSTIQYYKTAYSHTEPLRVKKFKSIRTDDLQKVLSDCSHLSKSSSDAIMSLFHGMYKYAIIHEIVDKDYSRYIFNESHKSDPIHSPFTDDEIKKLWDIKAYPVLIMIFTGLRVAEFLSIETKNIDLDARIMVGGMKTDAGRNRIIPIHDAILPIIKSMMDKKYLIRDRIIGYDAFRDHTFDKYMDQIGSTHTPHDTRHTCATLMERYGIPLHHQKLILGHAINDITQSVYTHIAPDILVNDINKIPSFK